MRAEDMTTLSRFAGTRQLSDSKAEVIKPIPPLFLRGTVYLIAGVLVLALILSVIFRIDQIVKAKGHVTTVSETVRLQAQREGVILRQMVRPGERVAAGQVLMELESQETAVELETAQRRLTLAEERLATAMAARVVIGDLLAAPATVRALDADTLRGIGESIQVVNQLLSATLAVEQAEQTIAGVEADSRARMLDEITLNEARIQVLQRSLDTLRRELGLREESVQRAAAELREVEGLAERRIVSAQDVEAARERLLTSQSSVIERSRAISDTELDISNRRLGIAELRERIRTLETRNREVLDQAQLTYRQAISSMAGHLGDLERTVASTRADVETHRGQSMLLDTQRRLLTIESPVDGILTGFGGVQPGSVTTRGSTIATIVPDGAATVVIATLANKDSGFVRPGSRAKVKVDAYPYRRFGTIPATVESVFPDPESTEKFGVRLVLERSRVEQRGTVHDLSNGMSVEVDVITERPRIISLLFRRNG